MNINYIRVGDYFIPGLTLPEEIRPIGKWGRMHRDYLREHKPIQYNCLLLSGKLWTYLGQHRTIVSAAFAQSFAPSVQL